MYAVTVMAAVLYEGKDPDENWGTEGHRQSSSMESGKP